MHLAVFSAYASVCIENHCRVVVQSRSPALEHARHYDHTVGSSRCSIKFRELARNLFCIPEVFHILGLTEIERVVKFGQNHHARAVSGKILDRCQIAGTVGIDVLGKTVLYYSYFHSAVIIFS